MKRLLIIVNPIAGKTAKCDVVKKILSHVDIRKYDVTVRLTSYSGHALRISKEAVNNGVDIVVAVGGDGTVNEIASALVDTNVVFAIIPCGSGNGLARHLGLPMKIKKAVEVINRGKSNIIDTIVVDGKCCFCTAGIGYEALVTAEYSKARTRGLVTYIKKSILGWFTYEPQEYIIEVNGCTLKRKAVSITFANANQWGNEFHVAPKASLNDGLIDVTIIKHPIKIANALLMPMQILGYSFDKNPNVETFKTSELLVKYTGNKTAHLDGEPFELKGNLKISVKRSSLRIIINQK